MGNRFYFSVGKVRTYAHSIFKTSGGWWLIKTQMAPFGTQMFSDVISGTKDTITRVNPSKYAAPRRLKNMFFGS